MSQTDEVLRRVFEVRLSQRHPARQMEDPVYLERRRHALHCRNDTLCACVGVLTFVGVVVFLWPVRWTDSLLLDVLCLILMGAVLSLFGLTVQLARAWHHAHQQWQHEQLRRALNTGDIPRVLRAVRRGQNPNALLIQLAHCADPKSPHRVAVAKALVEAGAHPNTLVCSPYPEPMGIEQPTWARATASGWPGEWTAMHSSAVIFPDLLAYYVSVGGDVHHRLPDGTRPLDVWACEAPLLAYQDHPDASLAQALAALDVLMAHGVRLDQPVRMPPRQQDDGTWKHRPGKRPLAMVCFGPQLGPLAVGVLERGARIDQADGKGRSLQTWIHAGVNPKKRSKSSREEDQAWGDATAHVLAWEQAHMLHASLSAAAAVPRRRL